MQRLSNIASGIFTALVIVGIVLLMASEMATPEIVAAGRVWAGYGSAVGAVALVWLNRLGMVAAVAIVAYMMRQPAKAATGIGQVNVKMVD